MTCVNCDGEVRVVYDGDGQRKFYTFPFQYYNQSEVHIDSYDSEAKTWGEMPRDEWSFSNPTTIEFITPPDEKFKIYRCTPVNPRRAVFHPGHPIRAQDLNDNFDQLGNAIQDSHCYLIDYVDQEIQDLTDEIATIFDLAIVDSDDEAAGRWNRMFNDDQHLVTALAASQRFDTAVGDDSPDPDVWIQPGKLWVNADTQKLYYWTGQQWVQPMTGGGGSGGGGGVDVQVEVDTPLTRSQTDSTVTIGFNINQLTSINTARTGF